MIESTISVSAYISAIALLICSIIGATCITWLVMKAAFRVFVPPYKPGSSTVEPPTIPPPSTDHNDGHFIDDPVAVVNTKPDFEGIGEKPINATKNCIIINGAVYAYKMAKLAKIGDTICNTCDLCDFCEKEDDRLPCSVFPESEEDGYHFERI